MNMQCVICGAEITKRSSLAYTTKDGKAGRACRTHVEVTQATQSRIEAEEAVKAREKEIIAKQKERQQERYQIPSGPSCQCCRKSGITTRDHWFRMMVANEKCSLEGKNPLVLENLKEAYGEFHPVLVYIDVPENHPIVKKNFDSQLMHQMLGGFVVICADCASRYGLKEKWEKAFAPNISEKALEAFMLIQNQLPIVTGAKLQAMVEIASK